MLPYSYRFTRFVVCPKCYKLYHYGECIIKSGSHKSSSKCNHISFPNHPQQQHRRPCGQHLLKTIQLLTSGQKVLYPFKVYCYKSLRSSLQEMLLRPDFLKSCQQWKNRDCSGLLCDVYDGRIWKEFLAISGQPFLASLSALALMLNVDWFEPYKHTVSSVGVVYLAIMNLPRSVRFKRQNIIIVGLIPGPSEPKGHINTFLDPLVKELSSFWTGVTMEVNNGSTIVHEVIRCALLSCACDLPAGRKVCGFLGHSASHGCSRCLKLFPGTVGAMNYSGFDRSTWPPRHNEAHRRDVQRIRNCKTKTEQKQLESELGCRYSALIKLPYFDPCRMLTVDPMHNLFLGSGKHMLQLWIENGLLTSSNFKQIQQCVDSFVVPSDVGRIPRKIETGFSGFTADQFKNWIITFSIPALFGLLPRQHLECWRHFVLACRILCKHSLSVDDISLVDATLLAFCKRVQQIYGEAAVTPNMHMHAHLKEVFLDYGPAYEFWLFSFERCNGLLGNQPNNNRLIEPQLMQRFLLDNSAYSFQFPKEFKSDFESFCISDNPLIGSVGDTISATFDKPFTLPTRCKYSTFDEEERVLLSTLYRKLYSVTLDVTANTTFRKYSQLVLKSKTVSCTSSQQSPCIVLSEWDNSLYGAPPTTLAEPHHPDAKFRPVKVHYFANVSFDVEGQLQHLIVAVVSWYFPHPAQHQLGKPAQVWSANQFESPGLHTYVPLKNIISRCAHCRRTIQNESVLVVVPLVE